MPVAGDDDSWTEAVRLWAAYQAFLIYAQGGRETERGLKALCEAGAFSRMCEPETVLIPLVPSIASPVATIKGSFYSFRGSQRRLSVAFNALSMEGQRFVSLALFQWALQTSRGDEARLIFLASVAEQLFFVYDDPQILSSIGGPVRLAQSASDIAIQKVLASAHGDPSR